MPYIGHRFRGFEDPAALLEAVEQMPVVWCVLAYQATGIFE
jgi:hypothetical protein